MTNSAHIMIKPPSPSPITATQLATAASLVGGGLTTTHAEFVAGMAERGAPVTDTEALLILADPDDRLTGAALAERATRYETGD